MSKKRYRDEILALRRAQAENDPENKTKKDQFIKTNLTGLLAWQDAKIILFYISQDAEVDTFELIKKAWETGKKIFAPRVKSRPKCHLELCQITDLSHLEKGAFDILEPKGHCPILKPEEIAKKIDLVIVPGIVFDTRGHRVGYGLGFYDRLLKKVKCPKIGLAYEFQIVEQIPKEDFDVPCDTVVTEERVIT